MFKKRVYLDYASITPVLKEVKNEIHRTYEYFANPSSLYKEGVLAKKVLEEARKSVATLLRAHSDEIYFTSGGTESNTLAILGTYYAIEDVFKKENRIPHIIISTIEHSSILEAVSFLEKEGVKVTRISPEENGIVDVKKIKESITKDTFLVSVQFVNNEIGTIQPIVEIAKEIRHFKKFHNVDKTPASSIVYPLFHTDACQAFNYISVDVLKMHVDLLTLDGSKVYGPRGIGMLFVKRNIPIQPVLYGGGQENGLRSGTENLPAICGFSKALVYAEKRREKESKRQKELQNYLFSELKKHIPGIIVNGSLEDRVSGNFNFAIEGLGAEFCLFELDAKGFAVSTASSCLNNKEESFSYVVKEIHPSLEKSSLRISFGIFTKKSDIKSFVCALLKTNSYKVTIGI